MPNIGCTPVQTLATAGVHLVKFEAFILPGGEMVTMFRIAGVATTLIVSIVLTVLWEELFTTPAVGDAVPNALQRLTGQQEFFVPVTKSAAPALARHNPRCPLVENGDDIVDGENLMISRAALNDLRGYLSGVIEEGRNISRADLGRQISNLVDDDIVPTVVRGDRDAAILDCINKSTAYLGLLIQTATAQPNVQMIQQSSVVGLSTKASLLTVNLLFGLLGAGAIAQRIRSRRQAESSEPQHLANEDHCYGCDECCCGGAAHHTH